MGREMTKKGRRGGRGEESGGEEKEQKGTGEVVEWEDMKKERRGRGGASGAEEEKLLCFRTILGSPASPPPPVQCMLGKCDQTFPWLDSCMEAGAGLDGGDTR